jgi:hypothetical protein
LQGLAKLKNKKEHPSFELCWLNMDDHDLNAFETRPRYATTADDLCQFTWRWGRAIENYLLPASAPAALHTGSTVAGECSASQLTAEVFVAIARRFFPAVSELESQKGKLCGHVALKWNDVIGPGWKACNSQKKWGSLLHSADVRVHLDPDAKNEAESLRNLSIELLGVAALLVAVHDDVYGSSGSRADEWLLHLSCVRNGVRHGKYDVVSSKTSTIKVDWAAACADMLALPAAKPTAPLNRGDADEGALWFNLPALCSFLANLCSCVWLCDVLGNHADSAALQAAAASALSLIQHALCVLLLGCDPALPAPQSTLFSSADCPCFLPIVGSEGKSGDRQNKIGKCATARCFNCGRDGTLHTLRQYSPAHAAPDDFLVELCRVGSVGWDPHLFMGAVHGRTHLGVEFTAAHIGESQRLYEQYLGALLDGTAVDNDRYLEMTLPAIPVVTVYVITDGKVKDGQMLPLLEQRRAEFNRLCSFIEVLIDAPVVASPLGTPTTPTSPWGAAARGGRASTPTGMSRASVKGTRAATAVSRTQSSSQASSFAPHLVSDADSAPPETSCADVAPVIVSTSNIGTLLVATPGTPSTYSLPADHVATFPLPPSNDFDTCDAIPHLTSTAHHEPSYTETGHSSHPGSTASATGRTVQLNALITLAVVAAVLFTTVVLKSRRH